MLPIRTLPYQNYLSAAVIRRNRINCCLNRPVNRNSILQCAVCAGPVSVNHHIIIGQKHVIKGLSRNTVLFIGKIQIYIVPSFRKGKIYRKGSAGLQRNIFCLGHAVHLRLKAAGLPRRAGNYGNSAAGGIRGLLCNGNRYSLVFICIFPFSRPGQHSPYRLGRIAPVRFSLGLAVSNYIIVIGHLLHHLRIGIGKDRAICPANFYRPFCRLVKGISPDFIPVGACRSRPVQGHRRLRAGKGQYRRWQSRKNVHRSHFCIFCAVFLICTQDPAYPKPVVSGIFHREIIGIFHQVICHIDICASIIRYLEPVTPVPLARIANPGHMDKLPGSICLCAD